MLPREFCCCFNRLRTLRMDAAMHGLRRCVVPVKEDPEVLPVVAVGVVGEALLHFAEIEEWHEVFAKRFGRGHSREYSIGIVHIIHKAQW
jgi:hypothetical protein